MHDNLWRKGDTAIRIFRFGVDFGLHFTHATIQQAISNKRYQKIVQQSLQLLLAKFERTVLSIDVDGLAFADFTFENVDAKRVENFFLDGALERARAVNRIVTFARDQFLGGIGKIERDLLLLEPFRQAAELDFNDLFEVVFSEAIKNDNLIDPVEKFGTKMCAQCVHY